jgi:hypothetical protein
MGRVRRARRGRAGAGAACTEGGRGMALHREEEDGWERKLMCGPR